MNTKRIHLASLTIAALLLPTAIVAQMDPTQSPQSPQNQPLPGLQPVTPNGTQPATTGNSPTTMRDTLGAPGQTGQEMLDKQFLQSAAQGGAAEVKLGMLAVQKGGPEVKVFGQKMVDDHTAINKDMAAVADSLGVMLPKKMTKEDQAEYDKLNGLSGDAFDKEYILYTAIAHRKDLREFRTEASVASDPTLATEVVKASMMIRDHLMMVSKLATDKGVTLPPRPPRPAAPPAGQ
jgi:putative membrane protein